jgi:hypothetical protein
MCSSFLRTSPHAIMFEDWESARALSKRPAEDDPQNRNCSKSQVSIPASWQVFLSWCGIAERYQNLLQPAGGYRFAEPNSRDQHRISLITELLRICDLPFSRPEGWGASWASWQELTKAKFQAFRKSSIKVSIWCRLSKQSELLVWVRRAGTSLAPLDKFDLYGMVREDAVYPHHARNTRCGEDVHPLSCQLPFS